jgi:fatty acid desaturase
MSKFKKLDKRVKKMDVHDLQLTKLSVIAFVCFVISLWNSLAVYIMVIDWWWYLAATIILAWRPIMRFFR